MEHTRSGRTSDAHRARGEINLSIPTDHARQKWRGASRCRRRYQSGYFARADRRRRRDAHLHGGVDCVASSPAARVRLCPPRSELPTADVVTAAAALCFVVDVVVVVVVVATNEINFFTARLDDDNDVKQRE